MPKTNKKIQLQPKRSTTRRVTSRPPLATDYRARTTRTEPLVIPDNTPATEASTTHVEQPVPLLMSGMTLWGAAVGAFLLIPVATAAIAASPLLLASSIFLRRT
jgi:hypothetical protein